MLCFFLSTIDHIILYVILKIKAPNILPQAASVHVLVWSFYLRDIPNVGTSSSSYTSRRWLTLLVLLQFYSAGHFRGCILTSLKKRMDRYFSRWPKISPQNWQYCVFVPSIEISSKSTWRVLDWFWTVIINHSNCTAWYKSIHRPLLIHSVMNMKEISIYYYCPEEELLPEQTSFPGKEKLRDTVALPTTQ